MKTKEDLKCFALKYCMDIARDYDLNEVKRFTTLSVQRAWHIGREMLDNEKLKADKKLKNFKL